MKKLTFWYVLGLVSCMVLLAIAYFYFQLHLHLTPCPLCMFQRASLVFIGVMCLLGLFVGRLGLAWQRICSFFIAVGAFSGIGFAARQVWLQYFPAEEGATCGIDPIYQWSESIGDDFGFMQMLSSVLKGSGDCSEIDWALAGVSMGGWMLAIFLLMALLSVFFFVKPIGAEP